MWKSWDVWLEKSERKVTVFEENTHGVGVWMMYGASDTQEWGEYLSLSAIMGRDGTVDIFPSFICLESWI